MWHSPWALTLLFLVPLAAWWLLVRREHRSLRFSTTRFSDEIRPTLRQRLRWLPATCTLLGLIVLIVALARPRYGRQQTIVESEGIAIEMVVDRSSSMQALDFTSGNQRVDRLTAIKGVAADFVAGREEEDLEGRISDLIGLITFAGYADAISPPTLDHAFLLSKLEGTRIVVRRSEDGTAIGDAVSLAIEKLNTLDDRRDEKVKSKVLILLTDGENTAGEIDPLQAAELAQAMDVKIYAIGVGTRGRAPILVPHPITGRESIRYIDVNIDEETLRKMASITGGKYFRATDTESLQSIYAEIDELEKTKVESTQFTDYREWAIEPFRFAGLRFPPLALIAMWLLAASRLLDHTLFRRLV